MVLTPFVWIVDVSSCGGNGPVEKELTGLALAGKGDVEFTLWTVAALVLCVALPFVAVKLRAGHEVWLQLLGVAATGMFVWLASFMMFFTIFSERSPRPAGVLALLTLAAMAGDALLRFGLSVQQWWSTRTALRDDGRAASG